MTSPISGYGILSMRKNYRLNHDIADKCHNIKKITLSKDAHLKCHGVSNVRLNNDAFMKAS